MDQDRMMLEYLMEMGAMAPEQEGINRQRAMVEQLRQRGGMPGMRDSGRMVHAANPLEFLSSVANTGLGEYKNRQADAAQDAYGAKRRAALAALQQRMAGTPTMGQPPQPSISTNAPMGMAGAPTMGQPGY